MKALLVQNQVNAAIRLWEALPRWRASESALKALSDSLPGFSLEECLLKSVVVNAIYGTNVLAIIRMAEHVEERLAKSDLEIAADENRADENRGQI